MDGWNSNSSLPRYPFPMVSVNAMAAATSLVNPFTPVTPPPESQTFRKPMVPPLQLLKRTASEAQLSDDKDNEKIKREKTENEADVLKKPVEKPTEKLAETMTMPQFQQPQLLAHAAAAGVIGQGEPMDPKYVAMLSRIAAHYQQRCQAVANYQNQRCQAWANVQRQKCQDMMQAAMLVVAWYIRDRIQRRRRKQRRRFRSGLRTHDRRAARSKITRGEAVRRWVLKVPDVTLSPHSPMREKLLDEDEVGFSMNSDQPPDKDAKLFEMADGLIKSQYSKVEVPLMGLISFDESDSDSDYDAEEGRDKFDEDPDIDMDEDEDEAEDYCDDDDDELLDDDDLYEDDEEEEEDNGSEIVHHGTGKGSGRNGQSPSSS